jgi:biotin carboxyl carrier protein
MAPRRLVARIGGEDVRVEIAPDGLVQVGASATVFKVARVGNGEYLVSALHAPTESHAPATAPAGSAAVDSLATASPVGQDFSPAHPRQWRVWVAGPPDARSVHVDGEVIELEVATEGSRRRAGRAGAESLAAPMPATVVEILVEAGQEVRQGDVLLKLEAMKMEMPLRAAGDGRVKAVRCTPGELVQPGIPLVEME